MAIEIAAPPDVVFRLAADVRRWQWLLPHYVESRVLEIATEGPSITRFAALRPLLPWLGLALPVTWRARTWSEPAGRRLRFVHLGGATAGMDVTWHIEASDVGTRVTIEHEFRPRVPGWARLVDRWFVRPIAARTLRSFKAIAEAVAEPAAESTPEADGVPAHATTSR